MKRMALPRMGSVLYDFSWLAAMGFSTSVSASPPAPFSIKPLREQMPADFGGIYARAGFAYQDHVAAMFCLAMMTGTKLLEVWCETYDDIVLVWEHEPGRDRVEFVQVKNEALPQLYSASVLLMRDGAKEGTSIFERSLARDTCSEDVRFRLITSRQVHPDLEPLLLDRDNGSREKQSEPIAVLIKVMADKPAGGFASPKKNGLKYWIDRVAINVFSENELVAKNTVNLTRFLESIGVTVYSDTVDELYQRLLWRVKTAAEADFHSKSGEKILKKHALEMWLREQTIALPTKGADNKLRDKLLGARQSEDAIESAVEMRRTYNAERRQPSYLSLAQSNLVTHKVLGILHQLRNKMDAGSLPDGQQFHDICIEKVVAAKDDCGEGQKPPEGLLLGCMYEIASRCRHRFTRPRS